MVAFEISVNGHHIRTITAGDFGLLNADVMWARIQTNAGPIVEEFRVLARGLEGNGSESLNWPDCPLSLGDTVTIRIVNADEPGNEPCARMTEAELAETASELAELEKWRRSRNSQ